MDHLFHFYRQTFDPFHAGRWVYDDAPKAKPEAAPATAKAGETAPTTVDFEKHKTDALAQADKLLTAVPDGHENKEKATKLHSALKKGIEEKFADLKAQHEVALKDLKTEAHATIHASYTAEAQKIVDAVKARVEAVKSDPEKALQTLEALAKDNAIVGKIKDAVESSADLAKNPKEMFKMVMELVGVIQTALKQNPPDLDTLGEMLSDVTDNPPRSPAKVMAQNKENYKKILDVHNASGQIGTLLELYKDPRGAKAKEVFSKNSAVAAQVPEDQQKDIGRYLNVIQPLVQEKITNGMGTAMTVETIEFHANTGLYEMTGYDDRGNKMALDIKVTGDKVQARRVDYELKSGKDGTETLTRKQGGLPTMAEVADFKGLQTMVSTRKVEPVASSTTETEPEVPPVTAESLGWKKAPTVEESKPAIEKAKLMKKYLEDYTKEKTEADKDVTAWRLAWLVKNKVPKSA
ncbi:MAG: hypothetical protein V1760_03055 [Candidatus Peregrinibacteria bacterium]